MLEIGDLKLTGTQIHYYIVCKRKLWLFTHKISYEEDSDYVLQGKILHDTSYKKRNNREVLIDQLIKVDILDNEYIGEVKSSSKMKSADRAQVLYYLYVLEQLGIVKKGKIHYPKERLVKEIQLTELDKQKVESMLADIAKIISLEKPPKKVKYPYCKKCAYFYFCWVGEDL